MRAAITSLTALVVLLAGCIPAMVWQPQRPANGRTVTLCLSGTASRITRPCDSTAVVDRQELIDQLERSQ